MKKRVLSVFLSLCMLLSLIPITAFASETHDISKSDLVLDDSCQDNCEGHRVTGTTDSGLVWKKHNVVINGGKHTLIIDNLNIIQPPTAKSGISISGNAQVTLVLEGENEIHGTINHPAIWVESGSTLTIEGNGSLNAVAGDYTGSSGAAGIGGGWGSAANGLSNCGDIIINSGNVRAEGSGGGAGIGGGYFTNDPSNRPKVTGNVTINGGFVRAIGGKPRGLDQLGGAGIGSGYNQDYAGTVTVNGGVVIAEGGNDKCQSIGGTEILLSGVKTENGTFTTGKDGNAVIMAAQGIGDQSAKSEWDAIIFISGADENSVTLADNTVTLNDSDAEILVFGQPVIDYNLVVSADTVLKVKQNQIDNKYYDSDLRIAENGKLINEGRIELGSKSDASTDHSYITLLEGIAQTSGAGTLTQAGKAAVRLPLSKELVEMSVEDGLIYNGLRQTADINVELNLWGYNQEFTFDKEYTVKYSDPVNAGTVVVTVASTDKGNLIGTDSVEYSYSIAQADFNVNVSNKAEVEEGETQLLSKLPKANITVINAIHDDLSKLKAGSLKWYMDAEHKNALTDTSLKDFKEGDQVTIYWTYDHSDSNFVNGKQGSVVVTVKEAESVLPIIPGGDSDNGNGSGSNGSGDSSGIIDSSITSPDTGASDSALLWAILMFASALALTTVLVSKKKKFEQ